MHAPSLEHARAKLEAAREPDEVLSPILPQGPWADDTDDRAWPTALRAGVIESRRGYRFRPENSAWVKLLEDQAADTVVDLGAGTGSLLLAAIVLLAPTDAIAVEVQPSVADRLRRTLRAHDCDALVLTADIREADTAAAIRERMGLVDLVVTNPPFYPEGWGRPSQNAEVHASTHSLHGDVRDFLVCAEAILAPHGVVWLVYDAGRLAEALAAAGEAGLGLGSMHWIPDSRPDQPHIPTRVWLRLQRDAAPIHAMR